MKILLVEDDPSTGAMLVDALTAQQYRVSLAASGQSGLDQAEQFDYDLVLLDIVIPGLDGIGICKILRQRGYQNPILLLTAKDQAGDRVLGLDAGADDYVVKPFDLEELLARIRALLRRGRGIAAGVITWENLRFDSTINEVTCGETRLHLTPKEYCLLELFLLNPKRVFSRRAILDRLWDFADSPGEETVSTHVKCLRQKVKKAGAADPIETVHGLGYRLKTPAYQALEASPNTQPSTQTVDQPLNYRRKVAATTARVWEKSQDKFLAQLQVLEQAAIALTADQLTPELQQQAKHEAHKLAGSLGVFGLMEGSQLARALEDRLTPLEILDRHPIVELVNQLQRVFQTRLAVESEVDAVYSPLILIVDDDLMLAEQVRVEAIACNFRVELATDIDVARKAIAQVSPDVILLDLNFPGTENGFTLLRELVQRVPKIPVLAFTGQGDLANRLEVTRLGGCTFLQKPLPIQNILRAVTEVLHQSQVQHFNRVLVVDDDITVAHSLSVLLEPFGIEVTGLNHLSHFWEVLTTTIPNLLLLDVEMPNFNGIELCQTVRSDPKWRNLPILFLSAHSEPEEIDRAFAAGADDYVGKSSPPAELAIRIMHRLRRAGFQGSTVAE